LIIDYSKSEWRIRSRTGMLLERGYETTPNLFSNLDNALFGLATLSIKQEFRHHLVGLHLEVAANMVLGWR
jgi:hypothetical protein